VNLAARLMGNRAKSAGHGVLVDAATAEEARAHTEAVSFERAPDVHAKGIRRPVEVYVPRAGGAGGVGLFVELSSPSVQQDVHEQYPAFGVGERLAALRETLAALEGGAGPATPVVLVEGAAGTGKTTLLAHVAHMAKENIKCATVCVDFRTSTWSQSGSALSGWFQLLQTLKELFPEEDGVGGAEGKPLREVLTTAQWKRLTMLQLVGNTVNALMTNRHSLEVSDDGTVEAMFEELHDLILLLLRRASEELRPVVLSLDGCAALGPEGLILLQMVAEGMLPRVLLLVGMRPTLGMRLQGSVSLQCLEALRAAAQAHPLGRHWVMRGMERGPTEEMVCRKLAAEGVKGVHEGVMAFIMERSAGVPAHAQEWARDGLQHGHLSVSPSGVLSFTSASAPARAPVPYAVRAKVVAHNDTLTSSELLALRVCSVVGELSLALLDRLQPASSPTRLASHVLPLVAEGVLVKVPPSRLPDEATCALLRLGRGEEEELYGFRSYVYQAVTCGAWGLEQRRDVHAKAVELGTEIVSKHIGTEGAEAAAAVTAAFAFKVNHLSLAERWGDALECCAEVSASVGRVPVWGLCVANATRLLSEEGGSGQTNALLRRVPHLAGIATLRAMETRRELGLLRGQLDDTFRRTCAQGRRPSLRGDCAPPMLGVADSTPPPRRSEDNLVRARVTHEVHTAAAAVGETTTIGTERERELEKLWDSAEAALQGVRSATPWWDSVSSFSSSQTAKSSLQRTAHPVMAAEVS